MSAKIAIALRERWLHAGLAAFIAVIWLATLPLRPLFNPDEGRYAEIPREMLQGKDWIIPHLDGLAYIEKPPLQYWATTLAFRLLGESAFSARLYTALSAIGAIVVAWLLARDLFGREAAWRAAAILGSMTLFVALGQLLTLDMGLTLYMTLALAGFLLAQRAQRRSRARACALMAWAATAFGVLSKGPIALVIPAGTLILYSLLTRDAAPWRRLDLRAGLPLFLLISVPWHLLAARRMPDFLDFYFLHEHVWRYLTPTADREEAWWFYGAVLLAGSLPWTLSALRALAQGWRRHAPKGEFDSRLFLWIWVMFVFGFFSLSRSKLVPYVLPAIPALAVLIGALPSAAFRRDVVVSAALCVLTAAVLGVAGMHGAQLIPPSDRSEYFLQLSRPLLRIAALLALSGAFVLLRRRRDTAHGTLILAAGWCLGVLLLMQAGAAVAPIYSGVGLAAAIPVELRQQPIYSVATYDQTLPFYLERTVTLAAYRGELDFGLRHAPGPQIATVEGFLQRWAPEAQAFAVMETDLFDELQRRAVPMRELTRDVHRVLVARR